MELLLDSSKQFTIGKSGMFLIGLLLELFPMDSSKGQVLTSETRFEEGKKRFRNES